MIILVKLNLYQNKYQKNNFGVNFPFNITFGYTGVIPKNVMSKYRQNKIRAKNMDASQLP